jgi:hypothetical protein
MGMSGMLFMPDIPILFAVFALTVSSMPLLLNTPAPQKRYYFSFPPLYCPADSTRTATLPSMLKKVLFDSVCG